MKKLSNFAVARMISENFLPGASMPKRASCLAIALILLSPMAFMNSSYAASRFFYDGFEDGTVNKWDVDPWHPPCAVVTSSTDRVAGPYAGNYMARCNWTSGDYQSVLINSVPYTNEIFYRVRIRVDQNVERTDGSPLKMLRIFYWNGDWSTYRDMFTDSVNASSCSNRGNASATVLDTYWGGAPGDNSCNSSSWHKIEYYFNHANGAIKVWHDGILIRNDTVSFNSQKWFPFSLASNFSDSHDNTNHIYFDDMEIFTDQGTGATGLMSDATISASGSGGTVPLGPPQNLLIKP